MRDPFAIRYLFHLALLCVPVLLASPHALAGCSGSVPFFVYGSCSSWKETRLEPDRSVRRTIAPMFAPAAGKWRASSDAGSGQYDVFAMAALSGPDGKRGKAKLAIRCRNDTTTARFSFAGYEMGNRGAAREIVYQVDDGDEEIIELERGSDHEVLGIDQGYRAVPFLRRLIGGRTLSISAIAADGRELRAVLGLEGLDKAIGSLRNACHW